jgi:hypothetical protein
MFDVAAPFGSNNMPNISPVGTELPKASTAFPVSVPMHDKPKVRKRHKAAML